MTNPLSLLRDYNINKRPVIERNNLIIFDEYSWPKTVKTNYVVCGSGKGGTPKEYYTLESLLYFLKNVHLIHPEYCQQARDDNVPFVRRPDRKAVLAYLNGEKNTSTSIDESAPIAIPNSEEEQTVPDINDDKRASKRKNEETSKEEKKIRCDVNGAQKASEMNPDNLNRDI